MRHVSIIQIYHPGLNPLLKLSKDATPTQKNVSHYHFSIRLHSLTSSFKSKKRESPSAYSFTYCSSNLYNVQQYSHLFWKMEEDKLTFTVKSYQLLF